MQAIRLNLTYNPYIVKSKININGLDVKESPLNSWVNDKIVNKRLQQWIDSFIEEVFKKYNTKEVDINFTGTILDSEDVKDAIYQFNRQHPELRVNITNNTKDEPVEDKVRKLKELFKEAERGPFDEFRSDEMKYSFNKALAPEFEVNVIATMSSGKSTVINAMLGTELMPAKNEACTATIAKISDYDDMPEFMAKRSDEKQDIMDDWQKADNELLEKWNDDENTSVIEIKGNIPAINEREGIRIVLVDTPGPNNSRNESHRHATTKAIVDNNLSMVLYVLNATQLSTDDDLGLLRLIRDAMAKGGREAQDRFIFIANKIDAFDPEKNEFVSTALNNIRTYLQENGIQNPLIIPTSAELTKLIRMSEFRGTLTRSQKGNLSTFSDLFIEEPEMNLVERVKDQISSNTYKILNNSLTSARDSKNQAKEAEVLSGIPIVETLLDNFILKHAFPSKLKDAVDSFSCVISKAEGLEKLNALIDQNSKDIKKIAEKLKSFEDDQERIDEAKKFRDKVKVSKYKISLESKKSIKKIERKVNDFLGELEDKFQGEIKPSEAKNIFKQAERGCEYLFDEIEEVLTENLDKEFVSNLDGLRDEYHQFISQLLNKSFPDDKDLAIREFQAVSMKMPDSKNLISDATFQKETRIKTGTERHGFLWLKKRNVYETRYQELVDMSEPWSDLEESIRTTKIKNFNSFDNDADDSYKKAQQILLKNMDEIDGKLLLLLDDVRNASQDKDKREKMMAENKEKLEWYNNFTSKLDEILAL